MLRQNLKINSAPPSPSYRFKEPEKRLPKLMDENKELLSRLKSRDKDIQLWKARYNELKGQYECDKFQHESEIARLKGCLKEERKKSKDAEKWTSRYYELKANFQSIFEQNTLLQREVDAVNSTQKKMQAQHQNLLQKYMNLQITCVTQQRRTTCMTASMTFSPRPHSSRDTDSRTRCGGTVKELTFKETLHLNFAPNPTKKGKHGRVLGDYEKKSCMCGLKFRTQRDRERHFGQKLRGFYFCDYPGCDDKSFLCEDAKLHKRVSHEGYNQYPCTGCKKFFATREALKRHQKATKCRNKSIMTNVAYESVRFPNEDAYNQELPDEMDAYPEWD